MTHNEIAKALRDKADLRRLKPGHDHSIYELSKGLHQMVSKNPESKITIESVQVYGDSDLKAVIFYEHSVQLKPNPKLKYWNGRPQGIYLRSKLYPNAHLSIAATSRAEAQRLLGNVGPISRNEVKEYYNESWGNSMQGVIPQEPGVWLTYQGMTEPLKIV